MKSFLNVSNLCVEIVHDHGCKTASDISGTRRHGSGLARHFFAQLLLIMSVVLVVLPEHINPVNVRRVLRFGNLVQLNLQTVPPRIVTDLLGVARSETAPNICIETSFSIRNVSPRVSANVLLGSVHPGVRSSPILLQVHARVAVKLQYEQISESLRDEGDEHLPVESRLHLI